MKEIAHRVLFPFIQRTRDSMDKNASCHKIPVAVLGATGLIGQHLLSLLQDHPWFFVAEVAASKKSMGKRYGDSMRWFPKTSLNKEIADKVIVSCSTSDIRSPIVFSALDAAVAGDIETSFADQGRFVFSNAKSHRYNPAVPLFIPEVNPSHARIVNDQKRSKGWIITNPNCAVIGLAIALKPLQEHFGVEEVHVTTLQATSGAGYPGVASGDILDNIIPYIPDEETKMEQEIPKLFGSVVKGKIQNSSIRVSASCHRVPILHGHTESVSIKLGKKASKEEIEAVWRTSPSLSLPISPSQSLCYLVSEEGPQPRNDRDRGGGMTVSVGRLRHCPLFDYKFTLLVHNLIRGGAGGTLLMAEWMMANGFLVPNSIESAATPLSPAVPV